MPTTKTVNYTPEQVETMKSQYTAAKNEDERAAVVEAIAETFKKSKRSIVSKMSREGFYVAKKAVSKVTGAKPAKKEELAVQLRAVSNLPMVSAEKMNKTDIQDLINFFVTYNKNMEAEFDAEGDTFPTS